MSRKIVIEATNVSKQYNLGKIGSGTIKDDMKRWWYSARGKEDPFLRIGETNDRSRKGNSNWVWALREINFNIEQGDVVGVIGRNGAGKSTLLKLLSRTTTPTTGTIKMKGRVASLLEVGTGFHPDLTGRENIFLNGAILGMTKKEITSKFDEIVAFSGVERYIDTPVKRYSSGMYVRLAFAVAAHLESEILIVDEVLAVGDAAFQKKAIGKMQDVSSGQGRTVLFVSHNMGSIQTLCNKGLLLKNGMIAANGPLMPVINEYVKDGNSDEQLIFEPADNPFLSHIQLTSSTALITTGKAITFNIELKQFTKDLVVHLGIYDFKDEKLFNLATDYFEDAIKSTSVKCIVPVNNLPEGNYYVNLLLKRAGQTLCHYSKCLVFKVVNGDFYHQNKLPELTPSKFFVQHEWQS